MLTSVILAPCSTRSRRGVACLAWLELPMPSSPDWCDPKAHTSPDSAACTEHLMQLLQGYCLVCMNWPVPVSPSMHEMHRVHPWPQAEQQGCCSLHMTRSCRVQGSWVDLAHGVIHARAAWCGLLVVQHSPPTQSVCALPAAMNLMESGMGTSMGTCGSQAL